MLSYFALLAFLASAQAAAPSCPNSGVLVNGQCWYIAVLPDSCDDECSDTVSTTADADQIINFAGSGAADASGCQAVIDAFGSQATAADVTGGDCGNAGLGCFFKIGESLRCTNPATTTSASTGSFQFAGRYCACSVISSSGGQDPHFHGINGENLDIVKDKKSSNKYFSIYCDDKISVSALFSPNPEHLLFMTEFSGHFGDLQFSLKLGKYPQLYGGYSREVSAENKTRFVFEEGTIESDGSGMIAKLENLQVMIKTASDVEGNVYFDIDIKPIGPVRREASGIIGRSFERVHSHEEFEEYEHFMLQPKDDKFTACPGDKRF